jgi:hypothetical protein
MRWIWLVPSKICGIVDRGAVSAGLRTAIRRASRPGPGHAAIDSAAVSLYGRELTLNCGVDAAGDALSLADFGLDGASLIRDAGEGVHLGDAAAEAAENASHRAFVGDLASLAGSVTSNVWAVWSDF